MTEKDILRAIGNIDAALITEAAPDRRPLRANWQKWATLAACFCLIAALAVGYYNVVLRGAQAPGPESFDFETLAEMNAAVGIETLYNDENVTGIANISVTYYGDQPNQAKIRAKDGEITVHYYVLFGHDKVKDSYIGGYEEQKLRLEIGGVTVHYSKIYDGAYHSQAKFVCDGNLYVIDVTSSEDIHDIADYIESILG